MVLFQFLHYFMPTSYLDAVPAGITSSALGLKICTIIAGIKSNKLINHKKREHNEIVLLGKTKLKTIIVLIYWLIY